MVTYHEWESWVGSEPVTGPAIKWPQIDTVPAHYTAAVNLIDGDPGEFKEGIPAYLRRIHHDYLTNRPTYKFGIKVSSGYSIGYNVAIDWLGGVWKLRGFDIQCAANKGENDHTFAVLCLVDGADPLTDEAMATFRWIVAECEKRAGRELLIKGHQEIGATACPGVGIMGQIKAGKLSPRYAVPKPQPQPETPPVVRPPQEENDVVITNSEEFFGNPPGNWKGFIVPETGLPRHMRSGEWEARRQPAGEPMNNEQLARLFAGT